MTQLPPARGSSLPALPLRFARWYLAARPSGILRMYVAYAKALWETCSIPFLLRTLVSPWKNIVDAYPTKGLNLERIMEAFTLNMTARAIGLIFRVVAIAVGVVVQAACAAGFAIALVLWLTYPALLAMGILYLLVALV